MFGLVSSIVKERLYLGEATVATCIGIALGPHAAGVFDPRSWTSDFDHLLLETLRVVVALGVFAVGAELPRQYLRAHWRSLALLLGPNMRA